MQSSGGGLSRVSEYRPRRMSMKNGLRLLVNSGIDVLQIRVIVLVLVRWIHIADTPVGRALSEESATML
jgi:hypothetical protein